MEGDYEMGNMWTYVMQSAYPGASNGGTVAPRANIRGELVIPDFALQLVQDGRVWSLSNPTIETAVAMGGTSFADTTPALLLDVASGTTMIPLGINLVQGGTEAGAAITIIVTADDIARYSSGGTAVTPLNMRSDKPNTTAVTAYYGATAAANSDAWGLAHRLLAQDVTPTAEVTQPPEFLWTPKVPPFLVGPASLLVYTYAGTTQPSWFFHLVWAEIPTVSVKQ